jgi:glycerol-3-phosphate cytidylyltransferase
MNSDTMRRFIRSLSDDAKTDGTTDYKIGFTASCFDLFHAGHYLMLKDAKNQCDFLVVALQTDPTVDIEYRMKTEGKQKNTPIQSLEEREIQLQGCRYIDYIIHYETEEDLLNLLQELQPDVRILGSDWNNKPFTGYKLEIPIHWHNRAHNYSTSNLRRRVAVAEIRASENSKEPYT